MYTKPMSSPHPCPLLTSLHHDALSVKEKLDIAREGGDLPRLRSLRKMLHEKLQSLEKELAPERALQDYESQKKMWESLKVVEKGMIKGFDQKEYPYPDEATFLSRIMEKREIFEEKMNTFEHPRFLVVPLAVSLPTLLETYSNEMRKRKDDLVFSDGSKVETNDWHPHSYENPDAPVYVWGEYQNADASMRYDVTKYEQTSGKSKAQKVAELDGFSIILVEDMPDVPAAGTGLNGRKTPPAGTSPNDILPLLKKTPSLEHERGLYLEEYLAYALTKLQESNIAIDNYEGKGKITWIASNFLSGRVPYGCWFRGSRRAVVSRRDASVTDSGYAVRLGVGV